MAYQVIDKNGFTRTLQSGQTGHRKHYAGKELPDLLYGNGCPEHQDCFTCPLPDCNYNKPTYYGGDNERRR